MAGIDILLVGAHQLAHHFYRDLALTYFNWSGGPLHIGLRGRIWAIVPALTARGFGYQACKELRENPACADAYISVLSQTESPDVAERAAFHGADDVITGDLEPATIERHLAGLLPREKLGYDRQITLGDYTLDLDAWRTTWRGKPLEIGTSEFALLRFLMSHPGIVFSTDELIGATGREHDGSAKAMQRRISRLRCTLHKAGAIDPIRAVRGVGYVLDPLPE